MACISLEGVSHSYPGGVKAVNDLTLEVFDGELLVLLGPSGCGKSTTLRLIAGLESPDCGTLRLRGREANSLPPHARDVAMLFQEEALYPHLSVRDNLGFSLQARRRGWLRWRRESDGASALAVRQRVEEVAVRLGLTELLDRLPGTLSGGQRQRVALGRVLARAAGIWLLDEPFAHVDARLRAELRRTIGAIHQEHPETTIIYVTHDQAEALALADRVAVMNKGRIEQVGTPREIYEQPVNRFVAGFVGDPPMNLLRGRARGSESDRVPKADGDGMQGFRPEALVIEKTAGADQLIGAGTIVAHEWRGETQYVAVTVSGEGKDREPAQQVWVRVPLAMRPKVGDEVRIWGKPGAIWFDAVTGKRV